MIEQWRELKETITEMRDNDGTGTQQEVCKFLVNLMDVLEKQMSNQNKGELISRQAVNTLVDELARAISDERCFLSRGRSTGEIMSDVLNLPSVENKGEWIPVTERLPEENVHVLITVLHEGKTYVTTDDYFCYGFDDWKDDVIAWQSLPEPYKAEKGGEE